MSNPKEWTPASQTNSGSGVFVGRDLHIGEIDPKTKAVLHKLAKQTPALASVVERALHEGLISPDAVYTLTTAARNINEDVAGMLWRASQCINEDVAGALTRAGENINPGVAESIAYATRDMQRTVSSLEDVLRQLESASTSLLSASSKAGELQRVSAGMSSAAHEMLSASQAGDNEYFSWDSFFKGVGASLFAVAVMAVVLALFLLR